MLVQPALIAHLLCRPVSSANTRRSEEELQVLRVITPLCYGFDPPLLGINRPKESCINEIL
jgi:hypothetical protein